MMKKEIELKFLAGEKVLKKVIEKADSKQDITQGYLSGSSNIRVRNVIENFKKTSTLTIKSDSNGCERDEFEYSIPYEEGVAMLEKMATGLVFKTRYIIKNGKRDIWEIDEFHSRNAGLILVEIEIPKADYDVEMPDWMDEWINVTDDSRYYNGNLAYDPFDEWYPEEEDEG